MFSARPSLGVFRLSVKLRKRDYFPDLGFLTRFLQNPTCILPNPVYVPRTRLFMAETQTVREMKVRVPDGYEQQIFNCSRSGRPFAAKYAEYARNS